MKIEDQKCLRNIEVLNETLWEKRVLEPAINEWLLNFTCEERPLALLLLSKMMYFNASNIRYLLKALYRDLYRYPIIEKIRRENDDTLNEVFIEQKFKEELSRTRFLGVGNPSESGVHLLYYFRQENRIPKRLFVNTDDVVYFYNTSKTSLVSSSGENDFSNVMHYVFIDDLCGSGTQATSNDSNVRRCVENLKKIVPDAEVSYLMLFGVTKGVTAVKNSGLYDNVSALIEMDDSYKCFGESSRYFSADEKEIKSLAKQMAYNHGTKLVGYMMKKEGWVETHPNYNWMVNHRALGWGECQLLLSLHHNTPDNTLPIIWFDENSSLWTPIFKRYNKIYNHD